MKYQVIKAFIDGSVTRNVGDVIEADGNRLAKLLQYRLIGLVSQDERSIEEADLFPEWNKVIDELEKNEAVKVSEQAEDAETELTTQAEKEEAEEKPRPKKRR